MSFLILLSLFAKLPDAVREVRASSCQAIRVNVALGMTTQIVLEQEPEVTLHADQKHFKIYSNEVSKKSFAIIPTISAVEIENFGDGRNRALNSSELAHFLDNSFRTNLFVFFKNQNQLLFDLRFVEKSKADRVLKVSQDFSGDCNL